MYYIFFINTSTCILNVIKFFANLYLLESQNDVKLVAVFAFCYWVTVIIESIWTIMTSLLVFETSSVDVYYCKRLIENCETDIDLETCISIMFRNKVFMVTLLCITCLLEVLKTLHYMFLLYINLFINSL